MEVMATLHLTEAEVIRDPKSVLDKVQQGIEIVIEKNNRPIAVITAHALRRTISECIAIAERREKERGYAVTLDPDFAAEVEEIVHHRQPWNPRPWD